jgi:hypothetical protein
MRRTTSRNPAVGIAIAATLALGVACSDSPAEPSGQMADVAFTQVDKPKKDEGPTVHFARVKGGDGTLVGGTALSSARLGVGAYRITFEPPIGGCAATASSASFQGFDGSVFRITTQVSIGFGAGGAFDDASVTVRTFDAIDGASEDTSIALVMVCP